MSLVDDIKAIQRHCGAEPDGVFGPVTAAAVWKELNRQDAKDAKEDDFDALDGRTLRNLASLDGKAIERFEQFCYLAKATAATFGCDYFAISGTRTWAEQSALYQKYKAGGPKAAPAGYSWHNFGTAIDFGVFRGKSYLDSANPALARRVHAACAVHAARCGLEWGGAWKGKSCDPPHYQIDMGRSSPHPADRAKYKRAGSVL